MLARSRLRAVAVDGKTSRGARRADGTRVHLLGVAEHGGHLLDLLEVGVNGPVEGCAMRKELTAKGTATRNRIVEGAAVVLRDKGVSAATLDDVMARTQASKSQLFHYFPAGKDELPLAVAGTRQTRSCRTSSPIWGAWIPGTRGSSGGTWWSIVTRSRAISARSGRCSCIWAVPPRAPGPS
jgi:hypothetical protein